MCNFSFVIQQPLFSPEITAIAYQCTITANNTVTWNNNTNFITAIGSTYCTNCFYIFNTFGEGWITDMFSIRNIYQFVPYLPLKCRATESKTQIKLFSFTRKIFVQLLYTFFNDSRLGYWVTYFIFIYNLPFPGIYKENFCNRIAITFYWYYSYWRIVVCN